MSWKSLVGAGLVCLLSGSTAFAADGLVWKWEEGQSRRYHIQAQIELAEVLRMRALNNTDVRVRAVHFNINTNCSAIAPVGKKGWELACVFDDLAISAAAVQSEIGRLQPILDEVDEDLSDATMQIILSNDGRVKNIDLEGVIKRDKRTNDRQEVLRLLLGRAFSALDMQLPPKGSDKGKAWRQQTPRIVEFPSSKGSLGMVEVNSIVKEIKGNKVIIESTGKGTIGGGEVVVIGDGERPKNMYTTTVRSVASFNVGRGELMEREYLVQGIPTASSVVSEAGSGPHYIQAVRLAVIPPQVTLPAFGANEELE